MKVADYVTIEDFSYRSSASGHESKIIQAGTFVKPIDAYYIPKHVMEDPRWVAFDKRVEIFCYCSYGIIPIPRKLLRTI